MIAVIPQRLLEYCYFRCIDQHYDDIIYININVPIALIEMAQSKL